MVGRMIICCLLFSLGAAAQEQKSPTFMDRIHQVQQFLDDRAKKKVDPDYIEVPDKPWRVVLRYTILAVGTSCGDRYLSHGSRHT